MNAPYETIPNRQIVPNLLMLLGVIGYNYQNISDENYKRICRSIFMESICRTIEHFIKTTKFDKIKLLKKILTQENYTNIFFKNRFMSTTPFAIVAYLETLQKINSSNEEILDMFVNNNNISVTIFFKKYFDDIMKVNSNKQLVDIQKALVLVSINKLNLTDELIFNVDDVIAKSNEELTNMEKEIIKIKECKKLKLDKKQNRAYVRIEKFLKDNASCINPHSNMPKTFSKEEVRKLNRNRDPDNLLELMPNKLLRHHCCYEDVQII